MGLVASLPVASDLRWPTGWQLSIDPSTRAFLDVLRRLNPGAYNEARAQAQSQVDELITGAVPGSTDHPVDYEELAGRLGLAPPGSDDVEDSEIDEPSG